MTSTTDASNINVDENKQSLPPVTQWAEDMGFSKGIRAAYSVYVHEQPDTPVFTSSHKYKASVKDSTGKVLCDCYTVQDAVIIAEALEKAKA